VLFVVSHVSREDHVRGSQRYSKPGDRHEDLLEPPLCDKDGEEGSQDDARPEDVRSYMQPGFRWNPAQYLDRPLTHLRMGYLSPVRP
jgi:hypothetical protein